MGLETNVDKVSDLNDAWPLGTDPKSQGDDHIRFCKKAMLSGDFSGIDLQADAITASGALTGDTVSDSIGDLRAAIEQALSQANNPNLIINGDMSVWQRGTSISSLVGVHTYTADRWCVISSGAATTVSRVSNASAGTNYRLRVTGAASNTLAAVRQRIESDASVILEGVESTLSFQVSSVGNTAGRVRVFVANAVNDFTAITEVFNQTFTMSSLLTRYDFQISAITQVGNGIMISIEAANGLTAGQTMDVVQVKLESGSLATPFTPDDPATNLAKCQRYFQNSGPTFLPATHGFPDTSTRDSTRAWGFVPQPVSLRANPTIIGFDRNAVATGATITWQLGLSSQTFYVDNVGTGGTSTNTPQIRNVQMDAEL